MESRGKMREFETDYGCHCFGLLDFPSGYWILQPGSPAGYWPKNVNFHPWSQIINILKSKAKLPKTTLYLSTKSNANLSKIKRNMAPGPDGIGAWMLRDLAPLLAKPIAVIFNSSIRDGHVPSKWKMANICPLPKRNPPKVIEKDIRPISHTPLLAKELERFVAKWVKSEIKEKSGMHSGCAIWQIAQKKYHGRTFRKRVRPPWRTVFPSGALF